MRLTTSRLKYLYAAHARTSPFSPNCENDTTRPPPAPRVWKGAFSSYVCVCTYIYIHTHIYTDIGIIGATDESLPCIYVQTLELEAGSGIMKGKKYGNRRNRAVLRGCFLGSRDTSATRPNELLVLLLPTQKATAPARGSFDLEQQQHQQQRQQQRHKLFSRRSYRESRIALTVPARREKRTDTEIHTRKSRVYTSVSFFGLAFRLKVYFQQD